MTRRHLATAVTLLALAGVILGASTISTQQTVPTGSIQRVMPCSPVEGPVWAAVTSATTATSAPYQPGSIDSSLQLQMGGFTGLVIRAKYLRGETLTTSPICYVWGKKGSDWVALADVNGSQATTLVSATPDADDGATYKWTLPSAKIDALGCTHIVVTVATAAVSSSAGAVAIEAMRF